MIGICCVFMHKINDTPNFSNHNVFFFFLALVMPKPTNRVHYFNFRILEVTAVKLPDTQKTNHPL